MITSTCPQEWSLLFFLEVSVLTPCIENVPEQSRGPSKCKRFGHCEGLVAMALSISFHGRIGAVAFSASGAVLARLH